HAADAEEARDAIHADRLPEQQVFTDSLERRTVGRTRTLTTLRRTTLGAHEHPARITSVRPDAGHAAGGRPTRTRNSSTSFDRALARRLLRVRGMECHDDRPRERLLRSGTAELGDEDLIALILGAGVRDHPARTVALELVRSAGGVGQ